MMKKLTGIALSTMFLWGCGNSPLKDTKSGSSLDEEQRLPKELEENYLRLKDRIPLSEKDYADSIVYREGIRLKDYAYIIESTVLKDSVLDEQDFIPPVVGQRAIIMYKDSVLGIKYSPSIMKEVELKTGKGLMLDVVIKGIGFFSGKKGILFYASGRGPRFCRDCNQLRLLYSLEGEEIYCLYQGPYEEEAIIQNGDFEAIWKEYGMYQGSLSEELSLDEVLDIPLVDLK
ncbi:hypothetical protein SapgrDRAFT_3235 [Saprospira grandis DSM 2844]|uniref:Uncharacterized protein n=1 Tax=Saprospira grandis DSM 2844 TaxID=694433 RepID=J1I7T6_9BACT|nr:hypothetical protein [Saprospira grandis]EJF54880.1 hypothetical protein SapgrDRAFT_3235 [Saprospira grandis DSM 2844]